MQVGLPRALVREAAPNQLNFESRTARKTRFETSSTVIGLGMIRMGSLSTRLRFTYPLNLHLTFRDMYPVRMLMLCFFSDFEIGTLMVICRNFRNLHCCSFLIGHWVNAALLYGRVLVTRLG